MIRWVRLLLADEKIAHDACDRFPLGLRRWQLCTDGMGLCVDTALRPGFPARLPSAPDDGVALTHEKTIAYIFGLCRIVRPVVRGGIIHQHEGKLVAPV